METVHLEGTFPSLKSVDVESASFVDLSRGSFPSVATLYLVNWAAATYIFDLADLPDLEAFYVMPAEFEGPSSMAQDGSRFLPGSGGDDQQPEWDHDRDAG